MYYYELKNAVLISRFIIKEFVKNGMVVADCTVGNGKDTLLLANKVGSSGKVYGFDIQQIAIKNTTNLLKDNKLYDRVNLIEKGHEFIDEFIHEKLDLIVYNLGYLPGADKNIKTEAHTTLLSIKKGLDLLKSDGIMIITVYTGHTGGFEEKLAIKNFLNNLSQVNFTVLKHEFINQENNPPILYLVNKNMY